MQLFVREAVAVVSIVAIDRDVRTGMLVEVPSGDTCRVTKHGDITSAYCHIVILFCRLISNPC